MSTYPAFMFKLLALIVIVVVITVALMRLRTRLPWNEVTKRADRRGLLRQPVDGDSQDQVMNLLMQGKKLAAIAIVRKVTGLSFRNAKLLVEAIEAGHRPARVVKSEASEH